MKWLNFNADYGPLFDNCQSLLFQERLAKGVLCP